MDRLLGTSSLMNVLNGIADRQRERQRQQQRKADAEASRAAIRGVPIIVMEPELHLVLDHEVYDDGRSPPIVLLADTLARHAPPPRDLTPFTRELAAA